MADGKEDDAFEMEVMSHEDAVTHPRNSSASGLELKASLLASRVMDPPTRNLMAGATTMTDPTSLAIGGILAKLLPAGLGAAIVILVDPPATRRDLFARFVCAFVASVFLGDFAMDLLRANVGWLSFLDPGKRSHAAAIDFIMGAVGWFLFGGAVMWLKKLRADPVAAVEEAKRVAP